MKKFDSFDKLAEFLEGERVVVMSDDQLDNLINAMTPELSDGASYSYCYDKNTLTCFNNNQKETNDRHTT